MFDTVASTSGWLRANPQPVPTLVLAHAQRAGYGQQGRVWRMRPGLDLVFSLWLPDDSGIKDFTTLTPWLAFQLRASLVPLSETPLACKWPNDLYTSHGKVSGTLVERCHGGLIVGTGINWVRTSDWPNAVSTAASPQHWLADWIALLLHRLPRYQRVQWQRIQPQWAGVDWFVSGEWLLDETGRRWRYGGVTREGLLQLQTAAGESHRFAHGQISLKRP